MSLPSEWWTYSFSDLVMYTGDAYQALLRAQAAALWPWVAAASAFGLWLLWAALRGGPRALKGALLGLGVCWLVVAERWFWTRLAEIDLAAPYYAGLFALQGALLIAYAAKLDPAAVRTARPARTLALAAADAGVVMWPLLAVVGAAIAAGAPGALDWRATPWFGAAPDATALATLGPLVALRGGTWLLAIPALWCLLSGLLQWHLGFVMGSALPALAAAALPLRWIAGRPALNPAA